MQPMLWLAAGLMISGTAMAQSYSNASVNGKYSVQFLTPQYVTWSKTFTCPTQSSVTHTANGSITTMNGVQGMGTFDGAGNFTFSVTNIGKVDATGSANTTSVTWSSSCQVISVNNGHVVYLAAATQSDTGTYSIKSSGSGTLTIKGSKGALMMQLAAANASGISDTVLLTTVQTNGSSIGTGIAVHE